MSTKDKLSIQVKENIFDLIQIRTQLILIGDVENIEMNEAISMLEVVIDELTSEVENGS